MFEDFITSYMKLYVSIKLYEGVINTDVRWIFLTYLYQFKNVYEYVWKDDKYFANSNWFAISREKYPIFTSKWVNLMKKSVERC